jgi:Fic family protein
MSTTSIVIVILAVLVIILIIALSRSRKDTSLNPEQVQQKEENLARSLGLARERGEITNNDIEQLLGISNATAERYLHELESRGHLVQIGTTGKGVRYRRSNN